MTLEEEINRFERLASNYEFNLEMHQHNVMKLSVNDIEIMKKYAQENRQRAEWLKELWALTEAEKEIRRLTLVWEEGQGIQKCIDILDKWHGEVKKNE